MIDRRSLLQLAGVAGITALARPAVAQSTRASVLRFAPQANLVSLDPVWTTASVSTNHGYYVFDTLYALDGKFQPQPQMAEGHEVSADGLTWRIKLREGLKFHDGAPVRSADCVASLRRWAVVDPLGQLIDAVTESWLTPDDRTMELRLRKAFPLMLAALAKPDAVAPFIMPERLAKTSARTQITEMIGSGPYKFVPDEFNPGSRVVYTKFDGYVPRAEPPDWATGGKVVHFDRVEWQVIPDASTAGAALQAGEIDWWERPSPDLVPLLKKDPKIKLQSVNRLGAPACMRLNCLQPPFNNVGVRRAMMMSVVQEDYMQAVFGDDRTQWSTWYSLFPPGTPYYSEDGAELLKGPHDSAAVHAALDKAGYAGEKVVILSPSDFPSIGPLGQVCEDALKRAGMKVELAETDWSTVVQRRTNREPVDKGGWSIFSTYATGMGAINPAVSPLIRGQGAKGWFGWFEDGPTEAMVQEWLYAPDEPKRVKLAAEINARVLEGVGTVPLGQSFPQTTFRTDLTGVLEANNPLPWNVRRV